MTRSYNPRSVSLGNSAAFCPCGKRAAGGRNRYCGDECRFWAKVQKGPQCWLWTAGRHIRGDRNNAYGQCYYKGRPRRAHIVSWALEHGEIPTLCVLHRCDTPLCVRPDHLFLGTIADNNRDAAHKGHLSVARPNRQKVTAQDIDVMRARVAAGETYQAVAADFGIARTTASEIIRGLRRRHDAPIRPSLQKVG